MKQINIKTKGVDLSYCQRNVDYRALKKQGIEFAIIRAGYREKTDDMLFTHLDGCMNAGIKCGAYVYAMAKTEEEAKTEARHALKSLNGYTLDYPVFYDLEDEKLLPLTTEQRTKNALSFLEEVLKSVYYPGIYVNPLWLENYLNKDDLKNFDIWLAAWTNDSDVPTKYNYGQKMWQWGTDRLDGVGIVNGNLCFIDYPYIINTGGFNKSDPETEKDMVSNPDINNSYSVFKDCDKIFVCEGNAVKLRKFPTTGAAILKVLNKGSIYRAISEIYEKGKVKWLYFKDEGGYSMLTDQIGDRLFSEIIAGSFTPKVGDKVRIVGRYASSAFSKEAYNSIYIGEERYITKIYKNAAFPYQLGAIPNGTGAGNTTGFANGTGIIKI